LRRVRESKSISQGDFEGTTSRVYVSAVERGEKQPTLPKIDQFADVVDVHPLTLVAFAYSKKPNGKDLAELLDLVAAEAAEILGVPIDRS
jgi:transcriptional regulator with XRE-family HTH domain